MTLQFTTSEIRSCPDDPSPTADAPRSDTLVDALDKSYRALQGCYGVAAALSTTTEQQNGWRTQSQKLRHLRLRVNDSDLYLVMTATAALTTEREKVTLAIDNLIADRF